MSTEMIHGNGTALAPRGPAPPAIVTDEHRHILREMIDRNATPAQVEMLILVGNRYGLDPIMGHVVLINGKAFVTHKGLMHRAHASCQFDGIETNYGVDELGEWCECQVWRRDMGRAFKGRIYISEYKGAGPVWAKYPRAMAAKTAESFVLRRAFDVSLTSQEEVGVVDVPEARTQDTAGQRFAAPRESDMRPASARQEAAPVSHPACVACGKALTKAQQDLSVRNYGEALCPNCQKDKGRAKQSAPTPASINGAPARSDYLPDEDEFASLIGDEADAGPGHGKS